MEEKKNRLIKLSNKKNILQLIDSYSNEVFNIKDMSFLDNTKRSWKILNESIECKNDIIKSFYFSMMIPYIKKIEIVIKNISNTKINSEKVIMSIERYYFRQISILSDVIIKCSMDKYASMINCDKTYIEEKFVNSLKSDIKMYESIFKSFPYWTKTVYDFLSNTSQYIEEVMRNLDKDYCSIKNKLYGNDFDINDIELEVGDRHNNKFVLKLYTDLGKLYYKPRSNNIEKKLEEIINLLRKYSNEILDIKFPESYTVSRYHWVKSVEFKPIKNKLQEENYYYRLGEILALYYILDGNDLHFENVISNGEYPILIDTETLFNSRMMLKRNHNSGFLNKDENNYGIISVKDIGIVPHFVKLGDDSVDISCINFLINEEDKNYYKKFNIEKSKLHLACQYISLQELEDLIVKGFASVYRVFEDNRNELIDKIYEIVKDLRVRFLKNATNDYSKIIKNVMKPICFYDNSYAFAISSRIYEDNEKIDELSLYEQKELISLNIPLLEMKIDENSIYFGKDKMIEDYFIESPWEIVKNKIMYMNEDDYLNQIEIIKMMFKSSHGLGIKEVRDYINSNDIVYKKVDKVTLERVYENIIQEIIEKRHINPISGEQFWIGYQLLGDKYQALTLPNSYYSGLIGIISVLCKDKRYAESGYFKNTKNEFLEKLKDKIQNMDEYILTGSYDGIGMYIRVLNDLYENKLLEEHHYIEYMVLILEKCEKAIVNDKKYDVLNGNAGLILSLVHILDIQKDELLTKNVKKILNLAIEELKSNITVDSGKYYFLVNGATNTYLTGYAHGSSGIITALYKGMKSLDSIDEKLIFNLLETERSYYDKDAGVWYKDNKRQEYSWGWCHGIPGILLSRVELWKNGYKDDRIESEIRELVNLIIKKGLGYNMTFCHGDIGIITIVKYVYNTIISKNDSNIEYILNYETSLLNKVILTKNFKNIRGCESVGLMDGLLGIAYYILCIKNENLAIDALIF